jgi:hypothetical protein
MRFFPIPSRRRFSRTSGGFGSPSGAPLLSLAAVRSDLQFSTPQPGAVLTDRLVLFTTSAATHCAVASDPVHLLMRAIMHDGQANDQSAEPRNRNDEYPELATKFS